MDLALASFFGIHILKSYINLFKYKNKHVILYLRNFCLYNVLLYFKYSSFFYLDTLMDIAAMHQPPYNSKFQLLYSFLSYKYSKRIFIKCFNKNAFTLSLNLIYGSAN
jgi:NADH:ubiquinone oxidoreductase subunit C